MAINSFITLQNALLTMRTQGWMLPAGGERRGRGACIMTHADAALDYFSMRMAFSDSDHATQGCL
jgi:hypothetical protein